MNIKSFVSSSEKIRLWPRVKDRASSFSGLQLFLSDE